MIDFNTKPMGIYIHIPFCEGKCPYCDFYSVNFNEELICKYTDALCEEIKNNAKEFSQDVNTIYFGGGTPNLIGNKNIYKIINCINKNFKLSYPNEVTIELNPSCHKNIDLNELKISGVNRLSIGMQSINNHELSILGRRHSSLDIKQILFKAKNSGFENISLDIMIAIPSQSPDNLMNSLEFCTNNFISHISVYLLKIEKGTKYFQIRDSLHLPNEDEENDLYLLTDKYLTDNGYIHYEISNFCRDGMESRHNLKYWNCDEYLAFGPSSHSFINGKRYYYPNSVHRFIECPKKIYDGLGGNEKEYCMLRLRLKEGLLNKEYKNRFGCNIPENYYRKAKIYSEHGLTIIDSSGIKLTSKGFLVSNSLILNIIY